MTGEIKSLTNSIINKILSGEPPSSYKYEEDKIQEIVRESLRDFFAEQV